MTDEEYQRLQRERDEYREFAAKRNSQLVNSTVNLKKEQSRNFIRWTNPTKTDEELKINQPCYEDKLLSVYQNDAKRVGGLLRRIKKIIKDTFTFDC